MGWLLGDHALLDQVEEGFRDLAARGFENFLTTHHDAEVKHLDRIAASSFALEANEQQMLDVIFAVGQYTLVSMALNSCGVQLDEGVPGFPG